MARKTQLPLFFIVFLFFSASVCRGHEMTLERRLAKMDQRILWASWRSDDLFLLAGAAYATAAATASAMCFVWATSSGRTSWAWCLGGLLAPVVALAVLATVHARAEKSAETA